MPQRNSICLSMIVKNEAPVIRRCLDSLRPLISHWVVVDTGSTDGTQALVREALADLPGALFERPWRDFAHNRSEALALAKGRAEFVFVIDADETLAWPTGFELPTLAADAYWLLMEFGGIRYHRLCLMRDAIAWRYRGVLHEVLEGTGGERIELLQGPTVCVRAEGARSRNPRKFQEDAAVLERALEAEPDNARYRFYLAQSCRDAGDFSAAARHYRIRSGMGGFDEEVWYAKFQGAVMLERLGAPETAIAAAYLAAYESRPTRAEPLVELARFHRTREEFAQAMLCARSATLLPEPADLLFVDTGCYAWRALDELAVAAWWARNLEEGARAQRELLRINRFPDSERARIDANSAFYEGAGFAMGEGDR
jgi:tetratricopeptide (TPR) repeat protein